MNIVLIGGQDVPGIGGVEAYMFNMARALCLQGHNVTIICSSREPKTTVVDGVRILYKVCPRSNMIALPLLFFKSIGYILKNKKDDFSKHFCSLLSKISGKTILLIAIWIFLTLLPIRGVG